MNTRTTAIALIPVAASTALALAAWEAWAKYAGVPKKNWKLADGCIVTRVEHGGRLPKDKQARNTALINEAFRACSSTTAASENTDVPA